VPGIKYGERWTVVVDTAAAGTADPAGPPPEVRAGDHVRLTGHSMVVLCRSANGDGTG